MNNIRAKFEEIWPVPAGVYWHSGHGCYLPYDDQWDYCDLLVTEWNDRLDTFTRCQETTDVYVSLIEEMLREIESCYQQLDGFGCGNDYSLVDRAKQLIGIEK